ncbi:hemagglutinin repeat-containing protein [Salmonella enterica]|nr:hemagglutinin repeat-containing protein [Salmonella enterica]
MNKNLYRIVFNKARGMLMVVADIARSGRAGSARSSGLGHTLSQCIGKMNAVSFSLLMALGAIQPVQAAIIADGNAPGGQQPTIVSSANGTPQVNIQTPGAGGVSRNTYSQFDVDKQGAILNNSHKMTQTQQGGWIDGNPWLAKGEARVILNEVNSRDPSRLNGYIEVAGRRAQVVIANPSGITCNGCGFINANRATLTTGQAQMNNGNLTGFNVERGEVVVEGAGMDSSRQDYTEIIARSTKINAGLWANDLKVTTGRNKVDAEHQQIDKQSDEPSTRPQFAVDVAKLGGMYAGKIRMIGTETGVGVRNAGNIGAQAGSVVVTADGRIENSGKISSGGDTQLASKGGVSNSGSLFAAGGADVSTDGEVQNSGSVAARNNVRIQAASLNSGTGSTLAAGVQQDGRPGGSGELALTTRGKLTAQGQNLAAGNLSAHGQGVDISGSRTAATQVTLEAGAGDLTTASAQVEAAQQLTASSGRRFNNDGGKLAANRLALNAHDLSNRKGEITQSGEDNLRLNPQGKLDNAGGRIASNGNDLTLEAGLIDNQGGQIVHAGKGALAVNTGRLQGDGGKLLSNGQLSMQGGDYVLDGGTTSAQQIALDAGSLSNRNGQQVQSGKGEMLLTTREGIDNQGGQLAANGNVKLDAARLNNQSGKVIAAQDGSLKAQVSGAVDNRQGQLAASGHAQLRADKLDNRKGLVSAATGNAEVTARQALDNRDGRIEAKQALQLTGTGLENQAGQVVGGALSLALGKGALNNQQGVIAASGDLGLSSGVLNNDAGLLQSASNMNIDTQGAALSNRLSGETGGILSQGMLTIHSGALDNSQGLLVGAGTTDLFTAQLDNSQGTLVGRQKLNIDSLALTNDGGLLQAGGDARIDTHGQALSNRDSGKNGGISSLGKLTIASGAVDNQAGFIASSGDLQLHGGQLDNRRGTLASEKQLSATARGINNQGGAIKSGQDMTLDAKELLDNSNLGVTGAGKKLQLDSAHLVNNQGTVVSADAAKINFGLLENQGGQLAAQTVLELHGNSLNNNDSGLIQSGEGLDLTVERLTNANSGDKGGITSQGAMNLTTGVFDNGQGVVIAGKGLQLDAEALLNGGGKLVAQQALVLNTTGAGGLNNQGGLVQSGADMHVDTHGQRLDNQNGTLHSLGKLQLSSGDVNNQGGTLGAKGDFALAALKLDNSNGGRIIGEQAVQLASAGLDNRNGQIQAVGNLLLDSAQGVIDNALGLIRSGATVTLNALQFINDDTRAENKGLEGQAVALNTGSLSNRGGSILANQQLTITNGGQLDNSAGQLAASENLRLQGAALNLLNTGGIVKAGKLLDINAAAIGGDGQLLSPGDMNLESAQGINNSGEMIANGNFNFTTPGDMTNSGKLLAGARLDLRASNLFNAASGEINAGQDWLTVNGTLTNYGLIDGKHTLIQASTLTNIGTGRIYGDAIGVQTVTFNNLAENGTAATLAGRERVDIGTQTLNNYDHGLIYSGGDMATGGQLDASHLATGQAGTLNNHSSTLESAGNMAISAGQINNVNDRFTTELVTVSNGKITEYQQSGDPVRWMAGEPGVFVDRNSSDSLLNLNTPGKTGHNNDRFTQYDYNRTVQETQVKESDPARIIAGGDMAINAGHLLNDKSQVIAGGTLAINAGSVDNVAVPGQRLTTDVGEVTSYYRIRKKGKDKQGHNATAYTPPTTIQTISLKPGQLIDHGPVAGNPIAIAPLTQQGTSTTIGAAGGVNAVVSGSNISARLQTIGSGALPVIQAVALQPGQQFEVANRVNNQQGDVADRVVRIVGPDTRLPDNSLFRTSPAPGGQYLVETDPRFTNMKKWLGSDYMQNALTTNRDNVLKRLGDGYYEQRLIREQVINLTGQRYLDGYNNDEEQFKALMDQGIAFSQRYNLKVGVALTAEQMALLTRDIVWLVNASVTLPDGSQQNVLVPQVYARLKPGDLDGSGALIAGRNVNLNLGEGLFNSGHIAGREVVKLSAANITNVAGQIQGADVGLTARTDINNIGGVIQGNNSLLASAGRDINAISTTRAAQSVNGANSFERTNIGSVAGMYVQGADGRLMLQAGRDIKLDAAKIMNSGEHGRTVLQAGHDLKLNTVTTSGRDNIVWDGDNKLKQSRTQQTGSEIVSKGDIVLNAGHDLTAHAAIVSAEDALQLNAGHDINIASGENTQNLDERHKVTGSSGGLSRTTTTTQDSVQSSHAQGSELGGDTVQINAGHDLMVRGSSVAGERDVVLKGSHDVTVEAATNTGTYYSMSKTKKSGVFGSGSGLGVTFGSQSSKTTRQGEETTQSDARSLVGTSGGNVIIRAGNQVTLSAADVVAGRAKDDTSRATGHIDITGSDIAVVPGRDTVIRDVKQETKSSGLTLSVKAPFEDTVRNLRDMVRGKDNSSNSTVDRVKSLGAEAGALALDGPGQMVALSAGRSKSSTESHYQGEFNSGSSLTAAGNIQMKATGDKGDDSGDILISGSRVNAGEAVILDAKRDVRISTSTDKEAYSNSSKSSGWHISSEMPTAGSALRAVTGSGKHGSQLLPGGMSQSENNGNGTQTTQNASVIHGSDIYVNSREGGVNIRGSELTATDDLMLSAAKGDIAVSAGRDTSHSESHGSGKTIGTLGGDGYSATVGYSREKHSSREDSSLENGLRSELTSQKGNIIARSEGDLSLSGTDIRAGKSVLLSGENVLMDVSRDVRDGELHSSSSQYGVTASAGGWAVDAAKAAETAARSAEKGDDPRLTAIRTGQSAESVAQGVLSDSSVVKGKVSVTAGSSSQRSAWRSSDTQGTTINAGENVAIRARNDIVGQGVQIAGKQVVLDAGQDTLLTASRNSQAYENQNSSNQFSVGAGVSFIGAQNGISVELGASQQKGHENSSSQRNTNSVIRAEELLGVNSGRDTTLKGAELEGRRVVVNTGRDLTLSSVQDTASYDSQQRSSGVGLSLCIPPLCYGASSGSVSASGENIIHSGKSVTAQSGIRAGEGGFDVTTGHHTQLDGAVIASTGSADKNRLDTGTLGWTDIHNESKTAGNSYTVALSGSAGGGGEGEDRNVAPVIGAGHVEKERSGTTSSAVSDGNIILRHPEAQTQDIAGLSRDTDNVHHGVDVNGNVQKVRDDLAVQSEGAALAGSALDTYGKYAEKKARESNAVLEAKLAAAGELDGKTAAQREAYLKKQPEYQNTDYGPGSEYWTKGRAAAGLLAGVLGGNLKAGAAAGAAPLLASLVKHEENEAARAALHGIVAAALTQLGGGSGSDGLKAGAAGAITASLVGPRLVKALYGKEDVSELSADEKRLVSNLVSVIGGVSGYMAGGNDVSMAATGANTARVEVENNLLGGGTEDGQVKAAQEHAKNIMSCSTAPGSVSCQKGLAMQDALMVALPAGLGGGLLAAATPELAAAAQAVLAGCQSAAILCLNQAGILTAEVVTPGGVGAAGILTVGKNAAEIAAAKAEVTAVNSAKPRWLQNVQAGNKFNAEQSKNYPYNELYVNKPNGNGYYRVDSYNPATGEIVSRKFTQFSDITEATATSYIREAVNKYPAGATIANVPSSGKLAGSQMEGSNILEVPPQMKPIPQSVLNAAKQADVIIRDTNGKVYK